MKLERKAFFIEIKSEDITEEGIFTGYASTFGGKPDSYGDVIKAGAFQDTLKSGGRNGNGIALLWQHNYDNPIGIWVELIENGKGLKVTGQLALNTTLGKDVYELLKIGAVKGLSIGWDFPRDKDGMREEDSYEYDDKKRIRILKKIVLWEISLVTFPANTKANITNVKSVIENAQDERELENALREECNMTANAAKYIVNLCKEKLFSRGKYYTEEELNKIINKQVEKKLADKMMLRELRSFNEKVI